MEDRIFPHAIMPDVQANDAVSNVKDICLVF